jgi:hypothetical protein
VSRNFDYNRIRAPFLGLTQNRNEEKETPTEEIIRILRKADGEQTVEESCREVNINEEPFS